MQVNSLKALEVFHGFQRQVPLEAARTAMRQMEHSLELLRVAEADESVRKTIALCNADDCLSTRSLRNWLERERLAIERAEKRCRAHNPQTALLPIQSKSGNGKPLSWQKSWSKEFQLIRNCETSKKPLAGCWRIFSTGIGESQRRIGGNISA